MASKSPVRESASDTVEALIGKKAKTIVDLSLSIADVIANRKEEKQARLGILLNPSIDINFAYNEVLINNFVTRHVSFYNPSRRTTLKNIKHEIAKQKIARNVIITGQAGVGKSTILKWLFVNVHVKPQDFSLVVYITSKMVLPCKTLNEFGEWLESHLEGKGRCLVFFDGLDELSFVSGKYGELEKFLQLFDNKSSDVMRKENHKFVISTRPEHFEFHEMIKMRGAIKTLNTYVVYEVHPLDEKESLKICKLVKKLQQHEEENGFTNPHFRDKWPQSDTKKGLTERDYLKCLAKYIKVTNLGTSLLSSPLLCRYAYQIISDWDGSVPNEDSYTNNTLSSRIERVIRAYVKWEYHDKNITSTYRGKGKIKFQKFENKVFMFLSRIATSLDSDDSINRTAWQKIKSETRIATEDTNAAFCVLQEDSNGNLAFIHKSFTDYFLAYFYVTLMNNSPDEKEIDKLILLIKQNTSFASIYTELLFSLGNELTKLISLTLLNENNNDIKRVSEFVKGKSRYLFPKQSNFTVEQYLTVYPAGVAMYAGCVFNREGLKKLLSEGILEIESVNYLNDCSISAVSKNANIISVHLTPKYSIRIQLVTLSFECVYRRNVLNIGGYWQTSFTRKDFVEILIKLGYAEFINSASLTVGELLESELFHSVVMYKKALDHANQQSEYKMINDWRDSIVEFLGNEVNYWSFFDGVSLLVCSITSRNERLISDIFMKGLTTSFFDYLTLWGEYSACSKSETEFVQSLFFKKSCEVSICFDSCVEITDSNSNCMKNYYLVHWKNNQLISRLNGSTSDEANDNILKAISVQEIIDLYDEVDSILKDRPNDKIELIISDEKLITYFILGKGDEMVELAERTIGLCKTYDHLKGKEFRDFLMCDETGYEKREREIVMDYLVENIWM